MAVEAIPVSMKFCTSLDGAPVIILYHYPCANCSILQDAFSGKIQCLFGGVHLTKM